MYEPLKNCPFCGEAATHSFNSLYGDMSMASCKSCGATAYAPKWNRRAVLAKWGQPAQAGEYPALVCDYCGALTPDPWHSSGMLHGKMSKHIHSCDACAARGAAEAQAADSVTAPAPPPECETEAEKRAFAFGWFKALESERMKADNKKKDPL